METKRSDRNATKWKNRVEHNMGLQEYQPAKSMTRIDGLRPKAYARYIHNLTTPKECVMNREVAEWLPKGLVEVPRFELPMDVRLLENMTPLQYLAKFVIITSRVKKFLYQKQFNKHREARLDSIDNLDRLRKALKDVCTFSVNAQSHLLSEGSLNYFMHSILGFDLNEPIKVNLRMFMGMAALAERVFNPNYMPAWMIHEKNLTADIQALRQLAEKEKQLQEYSEMKEAERIRLETQKKQAEAMRPTRNRLLSSVDLELEPSGTSSDHAMHFSTSAQLLLDEVNASKKMLETRVSITDILNLEDKPQRCPQEILEKVDFHAIKWKLNGIRVSRDMGRLMQIVTSL